MTCSLQHLTTYSTWYTTSHKAWSQQSEHISPCLLRQILYCWTKGKLCFLLWFLIHFFFCRESWGVLQWCLGLQVRKRTLLVGTALFGATKCPFLYQSIAVIICSISLYRSQSYLHHCQNPPLLTVWIYHTLLLSEIELLFTEYAIWQDHKGIAMVTKPAKTRDGSFGEWVDRLIQFILMTRL